MRKIYTLLFLIILAVGARLPLLSQCTFTTVPFQEGFEGITLNNQLPVCWAASNIGNTCLTYTSAQTQNRIPYSGSKFASFYRTPAGANYFYSPGIMLNAGVVYSTSVRYTTEFYGYTNWTDFSILMGTNQSSVGLTAIASASNPVISANYKLLSGTFTPASSGVYYFSIRATSNGSCCAEYLTMDDFQVTAPCSLNTGTVTISGSSGNICSGTTVTLTASGAHTYTWSNGSNSQSIVVTPVSNTIYSVLVTNTIMNCTATKTIGLMVNPNPLVSVFTTSNEICLNDSITLTGFGASSNSYTWSSVNGSVTGQTVTLSPTVTTTYTLTGQNQVGCKATATLTIPVNNLPNVAVVPANATVCTGESTTLTASGALVYNWQGPGGTVAGSTLVVNPVSSANYTVTGSDQKGCKKKAVVQLIVNPCTGINSFVSNSHVAVFPNPVEGYLEISGDNNNKIKEIKVLNAAGRIVYHKQENAIQSKIDFSDLPAGLYLLYIEADSGIIKQRVIKN